MRLISRGSGGKTGSHAKQELYQAYNWGWGLQAWNSGSARCGAWQCHLEGQAGGRAGQARHGRRRPHGASRGVVPPLRSLSGPLGVPSSLPALGHSRSLRKAEGERSRGECAASSPSAAAVASFSAASWCESRWATTRQDQAGAARAGGGGGGGGCAVRGLQGSSRAAQTGAQPSTQPSAAAGCCPPPTCGDDGGDRFGRDVARGVVDPPRRLGRRQREERLHEVARAGAAAGAADLPGGGQGGRGRGAASAAMPGVCWGGRCCTAASARQQQRNWWPSSASAPAGGHPLAVHPYYGHAGVGAVAHQAATFPTAPPPLTHHGHVGVGAVQRNVSGQPRQRRQLPLLHALDWGG